MASALAPTKPLHTTPPLGVTAILVEWNGFDESLPGVAKPAQTLLG
jgi:hypothetical protein